MSGQKRWTRLLMPNGTVDLVDNAGVMDRKKFRSVAGLEYWVEFVEAFEKGDIEEAKTRQSYSLSCERN